MAMTASRSGDPEPTAGERTLRVVESPGDAPDDADDVFVVESALREVPAAEFEDVFRTISEAEWDPVGGLPLYGAIRIHFAFLFAQNDLPPMAITHLVVLYRLLDRRLSEGDVARIDCTGVGENYRAVVADVAAAHGVPAEGAARFGFRRAAVGFLRGLFGFALLVVDQLFSLVWKPFAGRVDPNDTVFVPHVNRFGSTKPVLDRPGFDPLVVVPSSTVSWLRHRDGRYAALDQYDPVPLNYFVTPSVVVETVRRGLAMAFEVLVRRSFDRDVRRFLADEFGVEMPNTVAYCLGNLFVPHVPSLANAVVAERMLADVDPRSLVVGSLGSRQQAILYPAIDAGVDTYHVPHSATTGYELLPPPETVHFVPGEHVVDHLDRSNQTSDASNLVPTGRPQLASVSETDVAPRTTDREDAFRVVVATQPFADDVRRQFLADVLDGLEAAAVPVDVVVKIHPNESPGFYREAADAASVPVTVAEEDLHGYLAGADLVVTVNSNVGLESMALGTPCVCVSEWSPLIRPRPYATAGPVPVLTSGREIREFFAELDERRVAELTESEREFVREYYLSGDAAEEIATVVDAEETVPDRPESGA